MFELHEIMKQRESKVFAEILNRLREGNHTNDDLLKIKDRLITPNNIPLRRTSLIYIEQKS